MDAGEFDQWYAGSYPRLVAQLTAMIGDRSAAQDCVQDAFIRAWERRVSLERVGEREAWIRTTAYRLAVSRWRRLRRGHHLSTRADAGRSAPDSLGQSEIRLDLVAALQCLPAAQRRAIVLHFLADRTIAQIAEETAMPEGTVKAHLHRGRAALHDLLRDTPQGSTR